MLALLTLTACRFGSSSSSNNGQDPTGNPGSTTTNSAPVITGEAPGAASVGLPYYFVPQASDADGDQLTFQVANLPRWMSFNPVNGQLFGVPAAVDVGTYADVVISVSDGQVATSSPRFTITVGGSSSTSTGSARLRWAAPTQTTGGAPLVGLAGFRVYYGLRQPQFDHVFEVRDPAATETTIKGLGPGTWYFSVSAFTKAERESALSKVVMKTI